MKEYPNITIVTLFGGRWHLLEPYLYSLDNLDYPKDKLSLVWLTNYDNGIFHDLLKREADKRKDYKSVKLEIVTDIPISEFAHKEINDEKTHEHADAIARLYNRAFALVKDDYIFALEDDVVLQTYTLKKLLSHMKGNVVYACGAIFDRHKEGLFAWDLRKVRQLATKDDGSVAIIDDYVGMPVGKAWGVRDVGASTLAISLIRTDALKLLGSKPFKSNHPASQTLIGCDIVMCLDFHIRNLDRIIDYDVRALHFDSHGRPH
jgi:hypothetical protein